VPPPSDEEDLMTTISTSSTGPRSIDLARVCVAARAVLDSMPELVAEGLTDPGVDQLTRHARALIDLPHLRGLPLAIVRTHAEAVHDRLTHLAGDRSLTLAAWFDDGLGTA
jgi:hypothetical protein